MLNKFLNYLFDLRIRQKIIIGLSKGAAMMAARIIDLTRPETWEFSGFSQNGEDGIIDVLRKQLLKGNRYFIEIGAADGIENNSAWLVIAEKYDGLMIDGNPKLVASANRIVVPYSIGAECKSIFITRSNVSALQKLVFHLDPDVFSLDIDGNDFYIAEALLSGGFRPKIFVVEYNSAYGPARNATVEYRDDFVFSTAHPTQLYYGVSIAGWRYFFEKNGYQFVTVDRNGVNAFFVDPQCFDIAFLAGIQGLDFAENKYQLKKFRVTHEKQFQFISELTFCTTADS